MTALSTAAQLETALRTIRTTVALFGPDACCLSFNGGKDSTVLLHLLMQTFPEDFRRMHFVFFQNEDEFPEVQQFVHDMDERYTLNIHYSCASFREGLAELLATTKIKAIFLGTRVGDPHTLALDTFAPSDEGWPVFMRVHPILCWEYGLVWEYLRGKEYCSLYDDGYTSLGSVKDTRKNDLLRNPDGSYKRASALLDGKFERYGRKSFGAAKKPANDSLQGQDAAKDGRARVSLVALVVAVSSSLAAGFVLGRLLR